MFAVYERDGWAQTDAFAAYGVCNLPLTPGFHDVEAHCWRANNRNARMSEEIAALFAGARAELDGWKQCVIRREELYASPAVTVGMGSVHVQVNVLAKNLDISGVHVGGVLASAAADKARRAALRTRAGLSPGGKENVDVDSPASSPRNVWPGSPQQSLSGVASVRRAAMDDDDAPPPSSSHRRRAGRFSAPGGVTPDVAPPPRRSFRSSVSAVSAATDAFGGAGGRRARGGGIGGGVGGGVASSALSERRAERTSSGAASGYGAPVGGVGGGGYGGTAGVGGAFAHQREQIEDEPLNQPGGRRSRAFARGGGY